MDTIDLAYAKEHLEELIARAAQGEDVRISDPAHGTVKLAPVQTKAMKPKRLPGRWKDRLRVPDDELIAPLSADELRQWYGEDR